jgi:hypothetical protein
MNKKINRCIEIVKNEEELDGEMPDSLYNKFQNLNKSQLTESLRALIKLTKNNIIRNIEKEFSEK